jgi:erythromycin esterase-like protein
MRVSAPVYIENIRKEAHPITGAPHDYDPLINRIGDARFVLIGEASHGTHEFYQQRAEITKRLIQEKQFTAVAVEADWPDAYRVNRFVRGDPGDADASEALGDFKRFPTWMWRNADVLDFVGWLRQYNDELPPGKRKAGFYGLDLYSLYASIEAVLSYLAKIDPEAARRARRRYACFEHFGENAQRYGYAAGAGLTESCEDAVVEQLLELQRRGAEYAQRDGRLASDEFFFAEQNARLVRNAEEYYRSMFRGRISSWNLRDQHMSDTLDSLFGHLSHHEGDAKIVVWAHNSHLGDARATQMGDIGELNLGQLTRDRYGRDAVLIGFSTYSGTVTAASDWDSPAERKRVRPGLANSYEALFHEVAMPAWFLILNSGKLRLIDVPEPLLQRAIGVVYLPETERQSHYFSARLGTQFDAIIHFDVTRALEPLERSPEWETGEWETFPSGM